MRANSSLLFGTTAVLIALNYPLGALALRGMSPFLLILLRFGATAVIAWVAVAVLRSALPQGSTWWHAAGAGVLVQGAQFLGAYWAMSHGVRAGVTALIIAMNPVLVAILSGVISRRREPALAYLAVAIAMIAVVLACLPKILRDPSLGSGVFAALIALVGLAVGSVWQGRTLQGVSPVSFTAIGVTASLPFAGALLLMNDESVAPGATTWVLLAAVTVVGLLGTTAYAAYIGRAGARRASIVFAIIPALAAIGSWAMLGEPLDLTIGVALVLGCAACVIDVVASRRVTSS